ncbi:hypothetical protein LOK49_LG02G02321 [Camellia lanceoleosa]|uniref:Uncharacterized protein n=1 Tax=Camellia lanceoleosa TaxID=1840588 RepID=A0ACC0IVP5_9ERIC|nr:hypothetical protein LOK49_LG02G02321 [Camellia lanceoleosa]
MNLWQIRNKNKIKNTKHRGTSEEEMKNAKKTEASSSDFGPKLSKQNKIKKRRWR